jgi:hypothetical protein
MRSRIVVVWVVVLAMLVTTSTTTAQFSPSEDYDPDFFFNGFTETCNVSNHCWYDMIMGQTTEEQFLEFLSSLETDEARIERENPLSVYHKLGYDTWSVDRLFIFDETRRLLGTGDFTVIGLLDDELLKAIVIRFSILIALDISPQRVLNQLGTPVEIEWISSYSPGGSDLGLIYENIYFEFGIPNNLDNPLISDACLNPEDWVDQIATHRIIFFDPEDQDLLNDILALHSHALERVDVQTAVGLSDEEFIDLILNEERPCLEVNEEAIADR